METESANRCFISVFTIITSDVDHRCTDNGALQLSRAIALRCLSLVVEL